MLTVEQSPVRIKPAKERNWKKRFATSAASVVFLGSAYGVLHSVDTVIDIQRDARITVTDQGTQPGKRFEREVSYVANVDPRNRQLDWLVPLSAGGTAISSIGGICLVFSDRRR